MAAPLARGSTCPLAVVQRGVGGEHQPFTVRLLAASAVSTTPLIRRCCGDAADFEAHPAQHVGVEQVPGADHDAALDQLTPVQHPELRPFSEVSRRNNLGRCRRVG